MEAPAQVQAPVNTQPSAKRVCPLSTQELVGKILVFVEAFCSIGYYDYQRVFASRIIEAVLDAEGDTLTGLWSRQSGKSETISDTAISLCVLLPELQRQFPDDPRLMPFAKGFWVGIFAPVLDQAVIPYSRMRDRVNSNVGQQMLADPELNLTVTRNSGDTVSFSNGSYARARSASEDSQIEGGTFHLILLEEAQRLSRAKVNKEISPMTASTNGPIVKIGTAHMSKGGFHNSITDNIEAFKAGGKRNHFEFPYDLVIKAKRAKFEQEVKAAGNGNPFHLKYEQYVSKEIKKVGFDSDEFKMNFRLLWQETRAAAVRPEKFNAAKMDGAHGRPLREAGQPCPPGWILVAGLDVGKNNDDTVLTIGAINPREIAVPLEGFSLRELSEDEKDRNEEKDETKQVFRDKMILDWLELQGDFEGDEGQYASIVDFLKPYPGLKVLCVDSTGIGDPVAERLGVLLPSVHVLPFVFKLMTKHLLYKHYLKELHGGRIRYPAGPNTSESNNFQKFDQQHLNLDKRFVQGLTIVAHADEGDHDDYPDSAALMVWAEKVIDTLDLEMPEITMEEGPFSGAAGSRYSRYKAGRRG